MQVSPSNLVADLQEGLKQKIPLNVYRLWIEPLDLTFNQKHLKVMAPNSMHREEFLSRHLSTVQNVLKEMELENVEVSIGVKEVSIENQEASESARVLKEISPTQEKTPLQGILAGELNPHFTFEEFVVGPDNQMAQASCLAVAREPAKQFNPLFLYGNTGLGKTHLLQAIYHFIAKEHPHLKVVYTNCERFTNEFINAINSHTLDVFRKLYRQVDVLIVDDIQFLADKKSTQEEFFHTFNDLISAHKQVIVSSDSSPSELQKFEHRLTSRFSSGLVSSIDKPLFETRLAIIRHKCDQLNLTLDDDVKHLIAQMPIDNIREINGVLITLNAHFRFNNEKVTAQFISKHFPQYKIDDQETVNKIIDFDDVINIICSHFNIRLQDLQSKKRPQSIAYPRQISMYLLRKLTHYSLEEIGAFLGGRDHSTVQYAQMKIENSRKISSELDFLLNHLERSILKSSKG